MMSDDLSDGDGVGSGGGGGGERDKENRIGGGVGRRGQGHRGQRQGPEWEKGGGNETGIGVKNRNNNNKEDMKHGSNKRSAGGGGGSGGGGMEEENLLLRRHLRKQEEKIKLLATKLVRVVGERKNKEKRDEMLIEEQKGRLIELEGVVASLREKLSVSRHQLATYTKLIPTFSPIAHPSRSSIASKSKSPIRPTSKRGGGPGSARSHHGSGAMLDGEFTARVEQLLLEAKGENGALEDQLRHSRAQCASLESQLDTARRHLGEVESATAEELASLRAQLEQDEGSRRKERGRNLGDNIQMIRLQRESRRRAAWCSTLESQLRGMEEELGSNREKGVWLEGEVSRLEEELREEQNKGLTLGKTLEEAGREVGRLKEVEMRLGAVVEENRILKENHDSLLEKTLSSVSLHSGGSSGGGSRTEMYQQQQHGDVTELKRQLTGLESALKAEVREKAELGEELREEKKKGGGLEDKVRRLEAELSQLKTKLLFMEAETKKVIEKGRSDVGSSRGGGGGEESELALAEEELNQTKWQLVQVRDELDKTRSLLRTQMTISKEWGREVEELTKRLDRAENFHQSKLDEFMDLLERRTNQMMTLESTLEAIRPLPTTPTPIPQVRQDVKETPARTMVESSEQPHPQPRRSIQPIKPSN